MHHQQQERSGTQPRRGDWLGKGAMQILKGHEGQCRRNTRALTRFPLSAYLSPLLSQQRLPPLGVSTQHRAEVVVIIKSSPTTPRIFLC